MTINNRPTVGLVMKSLAAEFFQVMQASAEAHAVQRGDLTLLATGTQSQTEVDQQIQLVDDFTRQGVDALLIIPIDSQALVAPVVKALAAGIIVINFDVMLDQAALARHGVKLPFFGPDNVEAARTVGGVLGDQLVSNAPVIIIEGIPAASNAQQRKEGFMQVVSELGLDLVASQSANWEADQAYQICSELLDSHTNVRGIMCANDAMALGAVKFLNDCGLTGQIEIVGIDNDPSVTTLIKEGKILASIDLQTDQMVSQAIDAAMDALAGQQFSGWIKTPTRLVTRNTLLNDTSQ